MIMRLFSEFLAIQRRVMFRCCFSFKSSSKNGQKVALGEEGQTSQLQLSDLPNEILIRILSLLPTESAVRTCLLLRSWQHLWKSLTSLEFHEDDMLLRESHFMNFVHRVMDLRDQSSSLRSFSLQYFVEGIEEDDTIRFETWITKAVQCNVEELTLSVSVHYTLGYKFPSCMFTCKSLVKLDITFPLVELDIPYPPPLVCLPSLKYLRLEAISFSYWETTEILLSSPLLEQLILESCFWYKIESINVCSPKLQNLEIYDRNPYSSIGTQIRIIGDNLKSFSFSGDLINEYQICASSSMQLNKVDIDVDTPVYLPLHSYNANSYMILEGLSGTKNLALSDHFLEGLTLIPNLLHAIPIFECLTGLDIRVYDEAICIDSLALMKICERCPHLKYLDIGKLSHTVRSPQLSPMPLCFQTHLKKIVIHSYINSGDEEDDAVIDVMLNSALVLDELVIYCKRNEENGFNEGCRKIQNLQDRLNRRPKASKDCIISVSIY